MSAPALVADDTVTQEVARFIASVGSEDVPDDIRAHARRSLLDTVGCGLYGSTLRWSRILRSTLGEIDGGDACGVWGTGTRLSGPHAALANGAAVHAFELDDLHKESILHAGSAATPAALAAAEMCGGVAGDRFLTGVIVGYEVGARVGMTMGTAHLLQGWHPTGTHGALAAAAAAASVFGLTHEQAQHALGIAGSQAAGLMAAQYFSMVKRFHAGRAAQSGLYAALLARAGYTGIANLFESEYGGYCSTFSPTYDLVSLTDGLGSRWEAGRVGYKPYSANGSCHPAIEIVQEIRKRNGITADMVDEVRVFASSATVAHVGWPYEPKSATTAQMNLSYIVAVTLVDGEAFVDQFSESRISDPTLIELAGRVTVSADPDIDRGGNAHRHSTRISIHLKDGRVFGGAKQFARGSAAAPLADEEVRAKYRRLAGSVLTATRVADLEVTIDRIDQLQSAALASALAVSS